MSTAATEQLEFDPLSSEALQRRADDLDKATLPPDVNLLLLWDALTHCAEPADAQEVLTKIGVESEEMAREKKEREAAEKEHSEGKYRVKFDGRSFPERHQTWPEAFQLHVDETEEYFYVLKTKESQPDEDDAVYLTGFDPADAKTRFGEFGYKYACGSQARDEHGNLQGKANGQIEFNYAEHKMMGEMLQLRFSKNDVRPGTSELTLPNGVKLSYGEINGLGGDFFGGYTPICYGKTLDEQCKYFLEAFDNLGNSGAAVQEVDLLRANRKAEVDAIMKAVSEGKSTFEAYKSLKKEGIIPGLSAEDQDIQLITLKGSGPSYLPLAQINLDHFGKDAIQAYNAGHYCALKKAAEGQLETAYAMNAFADHYLGDMFASGHFRTPRRALHGSDTKLGLAWDALTGVIQNGASGNSVLQGGMKGMVPDLCSMLMHNEDNKLGITVKNSKGEEFPCWGDKQMFEDRNKKNREIMRQSLQASADEVYEAYEKKHARGIFENGTVYRALQYAPNEVVASKTHSPLFIEYTPSKLQFWKWPLKVREPFTDINSKNYVEVGGSPSLIELYNKISSSDLWKTY